MVGIITVFYSENCGSVLQAYTLSKAVEELGYKVTFISTRNKYSSHSFKKMLLSVGNKLLRLDFLNAKSAIIRYKNFQKTMKLFNYIKPDGVKTDAIETLILGSDTVWDIDSQYFNESPELFWPRQFKGISTIAYAPSVANSTAENMIKNQYPLECLDFLNRISVRDAYSMQVISQLTSKKVELVCDPTLLVTKKYFECFKRNINIGEYVLLYLFEELDIESIQQIKTFAKSKGMQIISLSKCLNWSERNIDSSIENFITYFANASYIITNTFHGTLFSIIYNKEFVCIGNQKNKIVELLDALKLPERIVASKANLPGLLDGKIDYDSVNREIVKIREHSYEFLNVSLRECCRV
jgi:hypothetical protein